MKAQLEAGQTTLASRLKNARENAGLSQTALAKSVGRTRQYIIGIEKGRNSELGSALAIAIADALKIPIRWLVLGDPLLRYARLEPEEERALEMFRSLPPHLKRHMLDTVKSLAAIQPTAAEPFPTASKPPRPPKKLDDRRR